MFSFLDVWQPVTGLHSVLHLSYLSILVKLSKLTSRTGWFVDDMYCNLKFTLLSVIELLKRTGVCVDISLETE